MRTAAIALLALACSSFPAHAQSNPPPPTAQDDTTITVEGRLVPDKDVARDLVRSVTRPGLSREPIARFQEPICFGSAGLGRDLGQALVNRMLDNADSLGIKTAGERCKPNVMVLFVDNIDAEVRRLRDKHRPHFGSLTPTQIRRVLSETGPVRSWAVSETKGRDGKPLFVSAQIPGGREMPFEVRQNRDSKAGRLDSAIRIDTEAAVVVIDRAAVPGKSIVQLADYATMRALAPTRAVPDDSRFDDLTILSLFNADADAPPGLTAFDRTYLDEIYRSEGNSFQVATLGRVIDRAGEARSETRAQDD